MNDPLSEYVAQLMKAKGVADSEEARAELLEKVNDAVDEALLEALPLDQLDKLEAAAKEDAIGENMIDDLLDEAGVDAEQITAETLAQFKDSYLKGEA